MKEILSYTIEGREYIFKPSDSVFIRHGELSCRNGFYGDDDIIIGTVSVGNDIISNINITITKTNHPKIEDYTVLINFMHIDIRFSPLEKAQIKRAIESGMKTIRGMEF